MHRKSFFWGCFAGFAFANIFGLVSTHYQWPQKIIAYTERKNAPLSSQGFLADHEDILSSLRRGA